MKASCTSHSNLALIKYWGNRDDGLRLPSTNSISLNRDGASTTTIVYRGSVAELRQTISESQFNASGEAGRQLTLKQALALALGEAA